MRKILGLSIAALLVMGLVGSGTWAFFNDTETSAGNSFAAGTLDLDWDSADDSDAALFQISAANGYPGNSGSAFKLIKNSGSFAGELDVAIGTITNTESVGLTEYEADVIGGAGVGELGAQATVRLWIDVNSDDTFTDSTDIVLLSDNTTSTAAATYATAADTIDAFGSSNWDAAVASMAANAEYKFYADWAIPTSVGNTAQGDSVSFDIDFTLQQPAEDA